MMELSRHGSIHHSTILMSSASANVQLIGDPEHPWQFNYIAGDELVRKVNVRRLYLLGIVQEIEHFHFA